MTMHKEKTYDRRSLRFVAEGILYRLPVGSPWRDLTGYFGA